MLTSVTTNSSPFYTCTSENGLRVVLTPSPTDVVYTGIAMATGTRHEREDESGMAHLVEHMTFKGTRHRSSLQVLNHMESVGGDLNAYTGKEETIYYCTCMRPHLHRAIRLLLDIVFDSTYPQTELEKEVEVVIDEIESYNDSPADLIYDDFEALLFPNHPLGRNILGSAERLRQYRAEDVCHFARRAYKAERAVLFVKGNVSMSEIEKVVRNAGVNSEGSNLQEVMEEPITAHDYAHASLSVPSLVTYKKGTHQAHVMLGSRAYAGSDPRYMGLFLLNNILGGPAMNSRLSLALRERAGLVYTVESNYTAYTDTGVWTTYFGCDPEDVQRCLRIIQRELQRLSEQPLPPRTLAAAKRQLKGQLGIASDHFESTALSMAKYYLHYHHIPSLEERYQLVDDLTSDGLQAIAREIFDQTHIRTLVYN